MCFKNPKQHLYAIAREPGLMERIVERVSGETQKGVTKISLEKVTKHNLIFHSNRPHSDLLKTPSEAEYESHKQMELCINPQMRTPQELQEESH